MKVKNILLLFDFSLCSIFFSFFFQCFSSVSYYTKQFLGGLHLSWEDFFTLLSRTLGSTWKQIQVEIKFLTRKAVVKISRISNSKNPPWNLVKFCSEIFLVNVSRIVSWGFPVFIVIGKTIKTPGFYNNVHLHICSIYLTLDVSSLPEL